MLKPINKKEKVPEDFFFTVSSRALMSAPDLTIMMALQWLIKSRGHSFFWSSYRVKLTLMGTLVVFPFPKNVQLMTSGISGGEKVWTSFFSYLCVHSHVHDHITHSVDSEMKRGEIKTHSKTGSSSL